MINGLFFIQKMEQVQDRFPGMRIVVYYDSLSYLEQRDGMVVSPLPEEVLTITNSTYGFEQELNKLWGFSSDLVILYLNGQQKILNKHVPARQYVHLKISTMLVMDQHEEDYWRSMVAFYEFRQPTWI